MSGLPPSAPTTLLTLGPAIDAVAANLSAIGQGSLANLQAITQQLNDLNRNILALNQLLQAFIAALPPLATAALQAQEITLLKEILSGLPPPDTPVIIGIDPTSVVRTPQHTPAKAGP